ncbi:MAG TPA: hypothetical protein VMT53_19495 [Terriglobales bacterium]|nr:hypothetical protein [Terriglobales bacterium]
MRFPAALVSVVTALTLLTACGVPRPPLPPSLELPVPVADLHATRKANTVTLSWTVPVKTTDKTNLHHLGPTLICRSLEVAINRCDPVGTVQAAELPQPKPAQQGKSKDKNAVTPVQASYTDNLSAKLEDLNPTGFVTYAVEAQNTDLHSAGLSNQVQVPLVPTLPAPANLSATVTSDGVVLTWTGVLPETQNPGVTYSYRIYRRDVASKATAIAGEMPLALAAQPKFLDSGMEWQKTYDYRITVVSTVTRSRASAFPVEGENSPSVQVKVVDVFPPAAPNGLQAVASGGGQQPFIDLTWAPNTESDLAGYYVYRRQGAGEWAKITPEPVQTPTYRDNNVIRGTEYEYLVSAVDLRGNESPPSEETNEAIH